MQLVLTSVFIGTKAAPRRGNGLILLLLFFCLLIGIPARISAAQAKPISPPNNREEAARLWEQAIAAKGGRERLYAINNLQTSVSEKRWWAFKQPPLIVESLYVFPGKSWLWEDQRGTIFGFVIWMHNYEQNIHWAYSDHGKGGSVGPILEGGRGGLSGFIDTQLNLLMETKWVKPIPVSVESLKLNGRVVDVVHTVVREYAKGEENVSFALDRKLHLPVKVIYHGVVSGKQRSGGIALSDYAEVDGIQMPGKVGTRKTRYQFNVEYNPRVFEDPPSAQAGINAWKKT